MKTFVWKLLVNSRTAKYCLKSKHFLLRFCHTQPHQQLQMTKKITINDKSYDTDSWTNVTDKIQSLTGRNLHLQKNHPIYLLKERIIHYFYKQFKNNRGNPIFSVHEQLSPVVTVTQNFDSLLIPEDHISRSKSDTYYLNKDYLLRAHTSAHQVDLIRAGLDNFLVVGDVYRRDDIDSSHYPIFHQMEGVRLCDKHEVGEIFYKQGRSGQIQVFENGIRADGKQAVHTRDAVAVMETEMKLCIEGLARSLFGAETKWRWVDTYFPFTHPSWELEIFYREDWLEVLGCGIVEHKLLENAGTSDKLGWAFGFGLERLAMKLFSIPDVRLFWSKDERFLSQFETNDVTAPIVYKPISIYPQCTNDMSFWIPESFVPNDFLDIVRTLGGDIIEKVSLIDSFYHPKKKQWSHCYRIVYRHMEKTLTQIEVNKLHQQIENAAKDQLNVVIR